MANLTLLELAKRLDPDGSLAVIANVLTADNPILQDAPWARANDIFSNKVTRVAALPAGAWRKLNEGYATVKALTVEAVDTIGFLGAYSEIDKALTDASPNPKQFRMSEAELIIEGISQTLATAIFYGNSATSTPESMVGIAPRVASLNTTGQVLDGGGSTNLTSIYIVQWGLGKVFMVYPRNMEKTVGISHKDLGEVTLEDAAGAYYQGYRDMFEIRCGLSVRDERCLGRIANIDSTGGTYAVDEDDLITLLNRMPQSGAGATIYMNGALKTQMEIILKDKSNVNWTLTQGIEGVPIMRFRGVPVKKCDAILNTETVLT